MYRVYYGDYLLHDLMVPEEEGYYLKSPKLTEEINKVAQLTFNIYPTHPVFDKVEKLIPKIEVRKDNKIIFKGRVIKEKQNMDKSKQVTCEGLLAFLFDSVQRPFEFQGSPEDLFIQFINNHNEQVEEYKRFKIGKTTGANLDNNEYINRSSDSHLNTFEAIESRLLNIGGYLYIRYEEDGNYIDWVDDFADDNGQYISTQIIEFGENLVNITVENDGANLYSVIIPLGADIENEDGTKTKLTIESVNDGLDYLVNEDALAKYGWIVAPISETTWNDVTVADNLKRKALDLLNTQGIQFKSTLQLNAVDLNVVDGNIDSFEMGEYIRAQSTPHNVSKIYLLTKKETPLTNPENIKITLGETKSTLTGIQFGDNQSIKNEINIMKSDYKVNEKQTNEKFNNLMEEIETNSSLIEQLPDRVKTEVSKEFVRTETFQQAVDNVNDNLQQVVEETKETLNTQLTQTSEEWMFQFEKVIEQITNVDGTVNANYQEFVKYIQLKDGTITLGEVGNPLILTLSNDRLSFKQNGVEVAYISDNRLYIYDGEFLNSLKIGRWVFVPRSNGNLSFMYV